MFQTNKLTIYELNILKELHDKLPSLCDLKIDHLVVINRMLGQWYIELAYSLNNEKSVSIPYDYDIVAKDDNGNPLGMALFYNENIPLCKIHIFRYGGSGPINVVPGSIEIQ